MNFVNKCRVHQTIRLKVTLELQVMSTICVSDCNWALLKNLTVEML